MEAYRTEYGIPCLAKRGGTEGTRPTVRAPKDQADFHLPVGSPLV
jgi:hypothetical protein